MLPRLKLEDAIASRAPALLDESPWPPPAALRWTPAYVAERFPLLDAVRRHAKAGVFWNVDRDSAAANSRRAEGGFEFTDSVHEEAAVPTSAFFESEQPQYYSSSLLDADGAPAPDLQPIEPLVRVLANASGSSGPPRWPETAPGWAGLAVAASLKAWWGTRGAVTPLHYDSQHNVYAQLHGEKTFHLFPPEWLEAGLYLYPRTHPLSHFSRVPDPTTEPTAGTAAEYPEYRGPARAPASRATLRAGDVLYLPPFWAHHAACERQCIAANVWVGSDAMLRHRAVEQAPLPFEAGWQGSRRAAAALLFLRLLLEAVQQAAPRGDGDGGGEAGSRGGEAGGGGRGAGAGAGGLSAAVARHLGSRWRHAASLLRSERGAAAAEAAAAECEPAWLGAPLRDKFARYAAVRAAALATLEPEVRATLIADQLDLLADWGGGTPAAAHALLERLHVCSRRAWEAHGEAEGAPKEEL